MKKEKNNKGITLIALVVTIIVLIILAVVSINLIFSDNGLIKQAEKSKEYQANATAGDQVALEGYAQYVNDETKGSGGTVGDEPEGEIAKADQSYVGYYADFQDPSGNQTPDGIPDGIIYADLAIGGKGTWGVICPSDYSYAPAGEKLKTYTIGDEIEAEKFGKMKKPMLTAVENSDGAERFYVMALEDIDGTTHAWYKNAKDYLPEDKQIDYSFNDFDSGRTNTDYWINDEGGFNVSYPLDPNDMWQIIKNPSNTKYNLAKWFVPSKSECTAFADMLKTKLGIDSKNYGEFGINDPLWSSSISVSGTDGFVRDTGPFGLWIFADCMQVDYSSSASYYVRLSAKF